MMFRRVKGFSLVELMIVVAIIGILIAVLLPELGDMATRARISTAQSSMNGVRDAIVRFQAQESRKCENLDWLVPRYLTENKRDPWGNQYSIVPTDGIIMSNGPDGKVAGDVMDPVNRDNLIVSYLPPLAISDAAQSGDVNGNGLLDNGDVITIYFSKTPKFPAQAKASGADFQFKSGYDNNLTSLITFTVGDSSSNDTGKGATGDPVAGCIGSLTLQEPATGVTAGTLNGIYNFVSLLVGRNSGAGCKSFEADIYVRMADASINPPWAATCYSDSRHNLAVQSKSNTKMRRPGEY
ncbi:MAG: prepilin-type N-terminal cleavage/methylation domain-containing protein [Candidatus Wallbacteria bacterium]|nr:prepilin-type N-terminal cleavage/methylation domain-containing protein [Candidatus Wallbacteria bacterium]